MNYTQYKYSRNLSWEILVKENVSTLPIKLVPLCRQMGIRVIRYCDMPESAQRDRDGCNAIIDGNYCILYNETFSSTRKRFTIAHELGHILMKHSGVPDNEHEANIFASRLLMPACVLYECGVSSATDIMELCDVSRSAAEIRLERLNILRKRGKFYTSPLERQVYKQFEGFITNLRRYPGYFQEF